MSKRQKTIKNSSAKLSRRDFLRATGLIAATASVEAVVTACQPIAAAAPAEAPLAPPLGSGEKYPDVPPAPTEAPSPNILQYLTADEAKTVDAFVSRILPGTSQDPGAHEAGVVTYIDNLLATNKGVVEPTYSSGPFAKTYEGENPPAPQPDVVWVKKSELSRYGDQGKQNPQTAYREGLKQLEQYAQTKFGGKFVDLSQQQQDTIIGELAGGKVSSFKEPSDKDFFKLLHDHTIQGMFSDPLYGGNRNMVGWKLVSYPGAQRAYTEQDLHTEGTNLPPQSLQQLPYFHPGHPSVPGGVLPVSGSDLGTQQNSNSWEQFFNQSKK